MDILERIEGLNTEQGIRYCGSKEGYMTILRSFSASLPGLLDEIAEVRSGSDLEAYSRLAHGVKSTMRAIGADELFEMAAALEKAGREEDRDFIDSHNDPFLEDCRKLSRDIAPVFEEKRADLPEAPREMLEDAFVSLSEFLEFYDYGSMDMVVRAVSEYSVPEGYRKDYELFLDAYKRLDREDMKARLTALMQV